MTDPTPPGAQSPPSVRAPFYVDELVTLHHGDCLDVMRELDDASVDAIVTDPPYGLEFMGRAWDSFGTGGKQPKIGEPDGSPHRRNTGTPSWAGSGNPVCRNCGGTKYDRTRPNGCACDAPSFPVESAAPNRAFGAWCEAWALECLRVLKPGGHLLAFGGSRTWHRLAVAVEDAGFEVRDSIAWLYGSGFPKSLNLLDQDGARTGWGTALKPAFEPIVVGRKPLSGTVAVNVLVHGTGALNIDACRTATNGEQLHASTVPNDMRGGHYGSGHRPGEASADRRYTDSGGTNFAATPGQRGGDDRGRWPTNVVLDSSQAAHLDQQTGLLSSGANPTRRGSDTDRNAYGDFAGQENCTPARGADSGGASRFFPTFHYEAKAGSDERPRDGELAHPTVKPLDLMRWLVRLVTPSGGLVLEPFAGSGTTAEACVIEGYRCIAIEREASYLPLIVNRLTKPIQVDLFGGAA